MLYGSQNFGYALDTSDKDYMEFIYPTWEDILKNNVTSKELKNADGSVTKLKDIRLIRKMIEKGNFNDLQFLYSKHVMTTSEFMWLFQNRERLVRANIYGSFKSNKGYILSCIKSGTRKDMVRALCFTQLLDRLLYEDLFDMEVKGLHRYRENESIEISVDNILCDLNNLEVKAQGYTVDTEVLEELDEFILSIVKENLTKEKTNFEYHANSSIKTVQNLRKEWGLS